ncbi:hypothetical protein Dda_6881 [Drechslerella dactyloides]|uniref:Uncharacterized protein n=1 Tax=Drechslerella dactyloides TaxID=74499 RepID=A0AAD6IUZ2_DREDA|nr:hypothetical protein Dda_6881 [Drechslerella dactyloides]
MTSIKILNMSESEQAQAQLERALAVEEERLKKDDIAFRAVQEIKSSILVNMNWSEMLMSAPIAISSLGGCFIASSSPLAATTTLENTKDSILKYKSMRANLVEVSNLGQIAFAIAEKNMINISARASSVKDSDLKSIDQDWKTPIPAACSSLMAGLQNIQPESEAWRETLHGDMGDLKLASDKSNEKAREIDKAFQIWLDYIRDFHAACVEKESSNESQLRQNEIDIAAKKTHLKGQKEAVGLAKKTCKKLSDQLDKVSEAFEKASDKFPSGWALVGQDVTRTLASTIPGAVNTGVAAGVGALTGGPPGALAMASSQLMTQGANLIAKKLENNGPPETPAFVGMIGNILQFIIMVQPMINGKDKGIDWEAASKNTTLEFVVRMLDHSMNSLGGTAPEPSALDLAPDDNLRRIISINLEVTKGILDEVKKMNSPQSAESIASEPSLPQPADSAKPDAPKVDVVNPDATKADVFEPAPDAAANPAAVIPAGASKVGTPPAADDPRVVKWKQDFLDQYFEATKLNTAAKSLPGSPMNTMPTLGGDMKGKLSKEDAEATRALLESATHRLNTTQQALISTQSNYEKSTSQLTKSVEELGRIKAALTVLEADKVTLAQVKNVLYECVKLIVTMKEKVYALAGFFSALSEVVEVVVESVVTPFTRKIGTVEKDTQGKIGGYTLPDVLRTGLYQGVISILGHFSVFSDIARMWVKLSQQHLKSGLALAEELGLLAPPKGEADPSKPAVPVKGGQDKVMVEKNKKLSDWASNATNEIKDLVDTEQAKVKAQMAARVSEISKSASFLKPSPATQKAIGEGVKIANIATEASVKAEDPLASGQLDM